MGVTALPQIQKRHTCAVHDVTFLIVGMLAAALGHDQCGLPTSNVRTTKRLQTPRLIACRNDGPRGDLPFDKAAHLLDSHRPIGLGSYVAPPFSLEWIGRSVQLRFDS